MKNICLRPLFFIMIVFLVAGTTLLYAAEPVSVPLFQEETAQSGVTSVYAGDWQYMVGGGAAAFDCNGNNFPDLALAGGED